MKLNRLVVGIIAAVLLTACAKGQPAIALPTATYTVVPPTATMTATSIPTATNTATPTSTATATNIATATSTSIPTLMPSLTPSPTATAAATTKPSPTPTLPPFLLTNDTPPLPAGKGGLIINNHLGTDLDYDIGGKVYKVPAYSRMIIFLAPGHYNFSGSAIGYQSKSGATDVLDGYYRNQDWG